MTVGDQVIARRDLGGAPGGLVLAGCAGQVEAAWPGGGRVRFRVESLWSAWEVLADVASKEVAGCEPETAR